MSTVFRSDLEARTPGPGSAPGATSQSWTAKDRPPPCPLGVSGRDFAFLNGSIARGLLSFLQPNSMIHGKIRDLLDESAGPMNRSAHGPLMFSEPEKYVPAVLRQETGAHAHTLGLSSQSAFDRYRNRDCFSCPADERQWMAELGDIFQKSQLRSVSVLENEFQPAVVVIVSESKCTVSTMKSSPTADDTSANVSSPLLPYRMFLSSTLQAASLRISSLMAVHPCSYS